MKQQIHSVQELGVLVRATRKSVGVRIDDLASTTGMSKQFVGDIELGKPGVQLGKVFRVLEELGIYVYVDMPDAAMEQLQHSQRQIQNTAARAKSRAQLKSGQGRHAAKDRGNG